MSDFSLIWCHGSLSLPWGTKSKALAETAKKLGMEMTAPDFRETENPDERVALLSSIIAQASSPVILAGSSMGAYVAAATAKTHDIAGLFMVAPAFYLPGYQVHVFSNLPPQVSVIHGWSDDVVPVENSIRFAKSHKATLHILEDNHRLQASTQHLCDLFELFLKEITE